jgi:nitrogenase iron protein NifH
VVQRAETNRKTLIEYDRGHPQQDEYRTLAKKIGKNEMNVVPTPSPVDKLEKLLIGHSIAA